MKPASAEIKHWKLVLADPASPSGLKAEAARQLGAQIPVSLGYQPEMDGLVQASWGTRAPDDPEAPSPNPLVERVRHALAGLIILGGSTILSELLIDINVIFDALYNCQTIWMKDMCLRALNSAWYFHRDSLPEEIFIRIKAALDSVEDVEDEEDQ